MSKLFSISETCKVLNLVSIKNNKPLNHTLRYWEKEFNLVKPKIINKRRYYDSNQIEILKMIKFLLKNKGMTINGVKMLLKQNTNKLDYSDLNSLKKDHYRNFFFNKSKSLLEKINKIKKYGKKNSS